MWKRLALAKAVSRGLVQKDSALAKLLTLVEPWRPWTLEDLSHLVGNVGPCLWLVTSADASNQLASCSRSLLVSICKWWLRGLAPCFLTRSISTMTLPKVAFGKSPVLRVFLGPLPALLAHHCVADTTSARTAVDFLARPCRAASE